MRGEYLRIKPPTAPMRELPPHARRILIKSSTIYFCAGTTSACAENTSCSQCAKHPGQNYLRMRGEYADPVLCSVGAVELPPHARRIPFHLSADDEQIGTTSACAENTSCGTGPCFYGWNYLRMRGEYPVGNFPPLPRTELPPHARRIRRKYRCDKKGDRTTSACAENTLNELGLL